MAEVLLQVGLAADSEEARALIASKVDSAGEGMSLGRRHLVCLARVLLQRAKVMLFDEATSALDVRTERRVQKQLMAACTDATTLSIAHRIQTVMDSDRVMMLDAGRIVEFGVPTALADQPNSRLAQLLAANSAP